jgi:V-type H+-transporting ATPase subunit C
MATSIPSHWIVSVPGPSTTASSSGQAQRGAADACRKALVEATGRGDLCAVHDFAVPAMKVGTLDQLMQLSDEASRADAFAEGVLKKVERQVAEAYYAKKQAVVAKLGSEEEKRAAVIKPLPMMMLVEGKARPVHAWAAEFRWDAATWGDRDEALPDVLRRLLGAADKIDADVRAVTQAYQEKKSALVAAERRRSGNLMVVALEDVLTPAALRAAGCEWVPAESEFLASVVVIVAKAQEEAFLQTYAQLDAASVPLGPEGRREAERGSPVVPGSARRVAEDKDGYAAIVLVVLKKFADSFRAACRERRLTVRDFVYDPAQAGAIGRQVEQLQKELSEKLQQLELESRRRYAEIISVWFHIKAVRVFVESVLRFGLPVNFRAVLLKLAREPGANAAAANAANAGKLLKGVRDFWRAAAGSSANRAMLDAYGVRERGGAGPNDASGGAADPVIPGVSDAAGASANPFVLLDFDLKEDSGAIASKGSGGAS